MSDYLVVGVATDYEMGKVKGPTVLNENERAEILRHCKFTDRVITGCPYTPTIATIKAEGCNFYAHGDDPCIDSEGVDVCQVFRDNGMFKLFKRTEGVSTTDITARLLDLAEYTMQLESGEKLSFDSTAASDKMETPPKQQFLATSRRIINFANSNMPGPNDRIVYIQGSYDLLHHGHLRRLQLAKEKGDFLYVGIWEDDMCRYYKGPKYPVISLQERVLMTLACQHVDDVVIGAPYIITKDLITSLNI